MEFGFVELAFLLAELASAFFLLAAGLVEQLSDFIVAHCEGVKGGGAY